MAAIASRFGFGVVWPRDVEFFGSSAESVGKFNPLTLKNI